MLNQTQSRQNWLPNSDRDLAALYHALPLGDSYGGHITLVFPQPHRCDEPARSHLSHPGESGSPRLLPAGFTRVHFYIYRAASSPHLSWANQLSPA